MTEKSTEQNTFFFCEQEEKGHGRIEQREYFLAEVPGYFNEKIYLGQIKKHRENKINTISKW